MTRQWYKATRPDGTSFYDRKTKWEVGKRTRVKGNFSGLCGPGILHVSDAPAETLLGGSWPCRLFLVKPGKIVEQNGHKAGARSVLVLEELPAWQALGPNGKEVSALIRLVARLTDYEAEKMAAAAAAAGDAAAAAARDAAWAAAGDAAAAAARDAAWAAARDAAWAAAGYAARDAARYAAWYAAWAAARYAAWAAAGDAARGLVVKDLITPEQFDTLYGPWQKVIGAH